MPGPACPPPPPETADEIELDIAQSERALFQARRRKWSLLTKDYRIWQQLNCDLKENEATGYWEYVLRENAREPIPPPNPARNEEVELTQQEAREALTLMQQQVWGEKNAAYTFYQLQEADRQRREQLPPAVSAPQMAHWALQRGQLVTASLRPPKPYSLTPESEAVFHLLAAYFAGDQAGFEQQGYALWGQEPWYRPMAIEKGLLLVGNPGVGKSVLARTYQHNPCRPYGLVPAKKVELAYRAGEEGERLRQFFGGSNGQAVCFEDLGTEEKATNNYGNKDSPMAQVILDRYWHYENGRLALWSTHFVSNYGIENPGEAQPYLRDLYGDRAADRLYDMCNLIILAGTSRR